MGELAVCRACLCTDVKLLNLHEVRLKFAFQNVTGIAVDLEDGQPQYLCTYCSALLSKCWHFKDRCLKIQHLFQTTILRQQQIAMDYIQSLDRNILQLALPYRVVEPEVYEIPGAVPWFPSEQIIKMEHLEVSFTPTILKEEPQSVSSDEEPLAKKIKKTIVKPKDSPTKIIKNRLRTVGKTKIKELEGKSEKHNSKAGKENVAKSVDKSSKGNGDDFDVVILSREEQLEELQKRRESWNYLKSLYKCDNCYKGFLTQITYKNHMLKHDVSSGPAVCEICETRWPDIRALRAHVYHSHERRYTCRLCGHASHNGHNAREHRRWHNGHRYVCKHCGAVFNKSTTHLTHVRIRHPSEYRCDECGETFVSRNGLNIHSRKAHRGHHDEPKFKCEECGKSFRKLLGLQFHKRKTHADCQISKQDRYKCSLCKISFRTLEAITKHTGLIQNGACDTSLSSCTQCGDVFSTPDLLRVHEESHKRDEKFKCLECNKWFARERTLAAHHATLHAHAPKPVARAPRVFQPLPPFVCEMCGRRCASKVTLICHQRTHTGETPFACEQCPKRFKVHQQLKNHRRTHTGERPLKCRLCPKAFTNKAALNRHERVHSGVKPYACVHCGKCFSQSNSMKLHVNTVHLKQPAPYRNRRGKASQ